MADKCEGEGLSAKINEKANHGHDVMHVRRIEVKVRTVRDS